MAGFRNIVSETVDWNHFDQYTKNRLGGSSRQSVLINPGGGGGASPSAGVLPLQPAWFFDQAYNSGVYLTTEGQSPLTFVGTTHALQTARIILTDIQTADNGHMQGLYQVIDSETGASVPAHWNEIRVILFCSDAVNFTYSSVNMAIAFQDAGGWNSIAFPMPAFTFTLICEITIPGLWNVWIYDQETQTASLQTVTQTSVLITPNLNIGDTHHIHNVGTLVFPVSGTFKRNDPSHYGSFTGTLTGIYTWLETGANVRAATGQYFKNPIVTTKQGSPSPLARYFFSADDAIYSSLGLEEFCPNRAGSYLIDASGNVSKPQNLRYGNNTAVGLAQVTAPIRILTT